MTLDHVVLNLDAPDGLSGSIWRFYLLRDKLVVDEYSTWTRETKRNKPKVAARWIRLRVSQRESIIQRTQVPLTPEIEQLAKRAFLAQLEATISVGFQEERL